MATERDKKSEAIQGPMLLTVIVEEACDVFSMFTDWVEEGVATRIEPVMMKFPQYCSHARMCHLRDIV